MTSSGSDRATLLPGDSEMARRMRDFDWSNTGLGDIGHWPQSLRTSVGTCLECAFPFVLWWGPDLITIYNDEYRSVLGAKHPAALGERARIVWSEIWDVIGPMLTQVMRHGKSTRSRDLLLFLQRNGYTEECYFSFSYSPIYDEQGAVGGVFCPVIETTEQVIGERRLRTLRDLASRCQGASTEQSVCEATAAALEEIPHDVPFAMIYLVEPGEPLAQLTATAGIEPGTVASPHTVALDAADSAWALGSVTRSHRTTVLSGLGTRFDALPTGPWNEPPHTAIVLPIALPGQERPRAVLVAAVSPRRPLDDGYRTFFELLATQIDSGLADARSLEEERHRAEALAQVRRESEQRVTRVLESITDAFQIFDADWRITYMNPVARQFFAEHGYDADAMIGKRYWDDDVLPEARDGQAARHMFRAMTERVPVAFENYYSQWDSWQLCRFDPLPDGGLANYFRDITFRKRAEVKLRESEERLAADLAAMTRLQEVSTRLVPAGDSTPLLLEIVDAAIAITAADMGNIQLFDRRTGALEIVASRGFERPFLDFFDNVRDDRPASTAAMRNAARVIVDDVANSAVFTDQAAREAVLAAGVRAAQSTPLFGRSGQLVGMLSTHYRTPRRPGDRDLRALDLLARQAADWIERTRAEEALRRSEERFRRYFQLGLIGMAITSPTKGGVEVNDRLCEILGYGRAELLQANWSDLTHPDDLAADLAQFNRVAAGEIDGYSLDKRWVRKDGKVIDTTISVNCVRRPDSSVDYFVALVQDVTERKRADAALRASQERYRALISQVRDYAIFSTDERGVVTTWNEGCQYVLGYSEAELVGLDSAELFLPEDRDQGISAAHLTEATEAGSARTDRWMLAKGGRRFFAMGATTRIRDPAGRLMGFSTVMRDMTQMKLSQDELAHHGESLERLVTERTDELQKTTERLRLSERMASLGTLSAGLGHDMGNLLLPLDVRLQLLLRADLPDELHEHVLGIQKSARYLQRLSNGLRMLATDPAAVPLHEATELGAWWKDVGMMLKDVLPHGSRLTHDFPRSPCWVAFGRVPLTQAVFNLVQNAADALREVGAGQVRISAVPDPAEGRVAVRVTDDGPGMTKEVRRRCLEPYFSTKHRAVATGMGLAFVNGLVTAAGGRIGVASALGAGTTISLMLPAAIVPEDLQDYTPRLAIVDLTNALLHSFVSEELRTLGFEVHAGMDERSDPFVIVVEPGAVRNLLTTPAAREAQIIVVGDLSVPPDAAQADLMVLGPDPDAEAIGNALRSAAERADAVGAW